MSLSNMKEGLQKKDPGGNKAKPPDTITQVKSSIPGDISDMATRKVSSLPATPGTPGSQPCHPIIYSVRPEAGSGRMTGSGSLPRLTRTLTRSDTGGIIIPPPYNGIVHTSLSTPADQEAEALPPKRPLSNGTAPVVDVNGTDGPSTEEGNQGAASMRPIPAVPYVTGVDAEFNTPKRWTQNLEDEDDRMLLNVGGVRHETHVSTLKAIPNSRLSRLAELHVESGGGPQEYFFDRHPSVFNAIIDFYRTGELHVPLEVCGAVVKRELDFWQIDEMEIKACCWRHYRSYIENQAILDSFNHSLVRESYSVDIDHLQGWRKIQMRVWLILDHPRTSKIAMAYGIVSFLFVVTSIAGFCLETLPQLRPSISHNVSVTCNGEEQMIQMVMNSNEALFVLDLICTVFFSLEFVLRLTFSPNLLKFVISPMNIIDLLALVPLYVTVIFQAWNLQACYLNEQFVIEIMFILRIFRMFRIFHLVKHYQALKVLVYALRASLQELLMLFIFLLIAMLIFATMIYYAERQDATRPSEQFNTIPVGFWWAIITMTTVGYGDVSPVTPVGYIVGTVCCVMGVLLVALTFPVISNNFTLFYTHVRSRPTKQSATHDRQGSVTAEEKGGEGTEDRNLPRQGRSEEEVHLLRSPYPSPAHFLHSRKVSTASAAVTGPYMNGGMLNAATPNTATSPDRRVDNQCLADKPLNPTTTPILAKFSDSNSMTDIVLSRGGRRSYSVDSSGPRQQQRPQSERRSQHSTGTSRGSSVISRKTQSDDKLRYNEETTL